MLNLRGTDISQKHSHIEEDSGLVIGLHSTDNGELIGITLHGRSIMLFDGCSVTIDGKPGQSVVAKVAPLGLRTDSTMGVSRWAPLNEQHMPMEDIRRLSIRPLPRGDTSMPAEETGHRGNASHKEVLT